jgi:hypothetical protein
MYIFYKIFNEVFFIFSGYRRVEPLLFARNMSEIKNSDFFLTFDLSHSAVHLGDRLFFLPLLRWLSLNKLPFILDDPITRELYARIYCENIPSSQFINDKKSIQVITKPMFLSRYKQKKSFLVVDFSDLVKGGSVSDGLVLSVGNFLYPTVDNNPTLKLSTPIRGPVSKEGGYILFSNYIDSGNFRKIFLNQNILSFTARIIKLITNQVVIHVGSTRDKDFDTSAYDFVSLDLRGQHTIFEILDFFEAGKISAVVTYDNFWMHIANLYNIPVFVLFRGRILRKNYNHHMKSVNNTFSNSVKIVYLN